MTWPVVVLILGVLTLALCVWAAFYSMQHERRKLAVDTSHVEEVRQLVGRYEQLAAGTLDAQTRAAADLAELRARAAAIEKILSTVG
jgi:hypothetical protein